VSGTTRRTHERLRLLRSHRAMLRPGPGVGPQTGLSRRVPHTSRVGTCELREKQINDRATLSETSFLVEGLQGRLLRRRRGGRGRLTRRGSVQFQSRVRPMHTATGVRTGVSAVRRRRPSLEIMAARTLVMCGVGRDGHDSLRGRAFVGAAVDHSTRNCRRNTGLTARHGRRGSTLARRPGTRRR
jgi:hypothetical protein